MKKIVFIIVMIFLCGCSLQKDDTVNHDMVSESRPDNTVSENAASDNEVTPVIMDDTENTDDIFPFNYYSYSFTGNHVVYSADDQCRQYYEDLGGSWLSDYDSYMDALDGDSEILDFSAYGTTRRSKLLEEYSSLLNALRDPALDAEIEDVMTAYGVDDKTIGSYVERYIQRADTCVYSAVEKCMIGELERGRYRDPYLKTCLYNGYFGYTFDSQTGERLALTDIVTDQEQLPELIAGALEESYQETLPEGAENMIAELLQDDALTWALGYQGITFYLQPEQIGMDGIRIYQVPVLFAAKPELFVEKYCDVPEYYAMQYDFMEGVTADINHDGKAERIDLGNWGNVADKFLDALVENVCLILISARNGEMFLYLYTDGSFDFEGEAAVYDLSGEEPVYVDTYGVIERKMLIDPAYVTYQMPDWDMLYGGDGLSIIYCISDISETGIPEDNEDTWYYERLNKLYQVEDSIEGRVINADGEDQGESITLTEGMRVMAFRTDRHSYIDFILEDGRLCRIACDDRRYEDRLLADYFNVVVVE